MPANSTTESFRKSVDWLSDAELAIARGLQRRPSRDETGGMRRSAPISIDARKGVVIRESSLFAHLDSAQLDASQNIEIACEAVKAVWSGVEAQAGTPRLTTAGECERGRKVARLGRRVAGELDARLGDDASTRCG